MQDYLDFEELADRWEINVQQILSFGQLLTPYATVLDTLQRLDAAEETKCIYSPPCS